MKTLYSIFVLFFICSNISGQTYFKSEKLKISFTSYEILESFEIESNPSSIGYGNENYEMVILMHQMNNKTIEQARVKLKSIALNTANSYKFKNISDESKIPEIKESSYVLAYDETTPMYVVIILNSAKNTIYEIILGCYNLNLAEGERIVKSLRLLK